MRHLLVVILLYISGIAHATNYYFSSVSGDDNRTNIQAQDPTTPWKSLDKLNTVFSSLDAGDSILFKRSETFYGSIMISKSGTAGNTINLGAYGTGTKPIISGFTMVTAWTNLGGNIWESTNAVSTLLTLNMVVINGANTAMGRYPNSGYLSYETHTGNTSITDNELTTNPDWTGAELVIKMTHWIIDRSVITNHTGTKITYSSSDVIYEPTDNFGYFIQNDPRTLDVQNEWYFDPGTKKIKIYSSVNPGPIQVASTDELINATNMSYLTIDNISFQGANNIAFNIAYSNHITIQNCNIDNSGFDAINAYPYAPNLTVQNCNINNSNNAGINAASSDNTVIKYNIVNNTGIYAGMGTAVNGNYEAIISYGENGDISYNSITNTGYSGIRFDGNSTVVKNNFVNYFCFIKDDGAGIYGYPTQGQTSYVQRTIKDNIVLNAIGAVGGTDDTNYLPAEGIYLDASASYVDIINNSVANCVNIGLFLNNSSNVNLSGNTIYNCAALLRMTKYQNTPVINNTFNNNRLIAKSATQRAIYLTNNYDTAVNYFTGDNNYYARPIDDSLTMVAFADGNGLGYYTLAGWKTFSGQDANSKKSPKTIITVNDLRFEYNETSVNKTISLGVNYIDVSNVSYPGTITIAPYTSSVLIKDSSGNITPTANAGPDQAIILPTDTVGLSGSGIDPDGAIVSYIWTKISGPVSGAITNPTLAVTTAIELEQGVYNFELEVTDNNGAVGKDTVQVTVNAANQSPIANAGPDKAITLPTNSIMLFGRARDADGTIASYNWTKISGPIEGTITDSTLATITVTGLVQGIYNFELAVTDNNGGAAKDTVQLNVNVANLAPIANAGVDQSISLPINSITLTGSGTDPDGWITTYHWKKISGPTNGTITSPTSAITTVTELEEGIYKFELRVTDNHGFIGAIGRDTMQVTVNPANQPPVADAGPDKTISLPINSVALSGNAIDADGTIISYTWTKIAGPETFNITNPASAFTTLTALVQGVYVFELKVIDNLGAAGMDTVQVTVNGLTNTPYTSIPTPIPGTIEVEDYDNGGQNIAYFDLTLENSGGAYRPLESVDLSIAAEGGAFVGWTNDNEWTKYTVNVTSAGTYSLVARVSTFSSIASFHVEMDGTTIATITVPYTGGYQTWQNITIPDIPLTTGVKVMRFYIDIGGFNITRLIFTKINAFGSDAPITSVKTNQNIVSSKAMTDIVSIYPNPATTLVRVQLNNTIAGTYQLSLANIFGKKVWGETINNTAGTISETINTATILSSGVYVLEIISADQKKRTYKIIKN